MAMSRRNTWLSLMALPAIACATLFWPGPRSIAADRAASGEPAGQSSSAKIIVSVPGIPGPYCAYGVEKRLMELPGVTSVATHWQREIIQADLAAGVTITRAQVLEIMKTADYPYDYSVDIK